MYELIAVLVTLLISTLGLDFVRHYIIYLDMSVGPVVAVCIMGAFILWTIRHPKMK